MVSSTFAPGPAPGPQTRLPGSRVWRGGSGARGLAGGSEITPSSALTRRLP